MAVADIQNFLSHHGHITLEDGEECHFSDPQPTGCTSWGEFYPARIHLITKPQNSSRRSSYRRMFTIWVDSDGNRIFETMLKYIIREEELKLLVDIDPFFVRELMANKNLPFLSFLVREESALA